MHPIKKEILEYLDREEDGAFYGDIVMNLNRPKYTVLKHILELKEAGLVEKDSDGGRFNILI
ncbi:MAG: hypothetical protein KQI35_08485 [Bacteroidetes bacterium]|nr:hypothetical protein [Bacteroidota bacterium]